VIMDSIDLETTSLFAWNTQCRNILTHFLFLNTQIKLKLLDVSFSFE
jgi:hypothetical protein